MTYIRTANYKGGINNLYIATDDKTGISATSTKSKEKAIVNLDIKLSRLKNKGLIETDFCRRQHG